MEIFFLLCEKTVDFPIDRNKYGELLNELMNGDVKVPNLRKKNAVKSIEKNKTGVWKKKWIAERLS
ncbi:MAG: hypothetical protein ACYSTS_08490 [Planctomycetota bacterium]|jgi:hypothetical protein